MTKWEYKLLRFEVFCGPGSFAKDLQTLGQEGWELVAAPYAVDRGNYDRGCLIFKRPDPDQFRCGCDECERLRTSSSQG